MSSKDLSLKIFDREVTISLLNFDLREIENIFAFFQHEKIDSREKAKLNEISVIKKPGFVPLVDYFQNNLCESVAACHKKLFFGIEEVMLLFARKQRKMLCVASFSDEQVTLRVIQRLIRLFFAHFYEGLRVLLMHSSAVVHKGGGILFLGPSGRGKTTVSNFFPSADVLADDAMGLVRNGVNYYIYSPFFPKIAVPSPWDDKIPECFGLRSPRKVKLKRIFFIHKSQENRVVQRENPTDLIVSLWKQLYQDTQRGDAPHMSYKLEVFKFFKKLIKEVPVQDLYFRKDASFLKLL